MSLPAYAASIGYFVNDSAGDPSASITAAGHTPVALAGLAAGDLVGIDVLWILNGDNSAAPAALVANAAAVASFVAGGGVLSYHDRYVSEEPEVGGSSNNTLIPGAAGITFVRDFNDDANIDIVNNTTLVTNGPGGVLSDTSLDGGNSSSHGFVPVNTLPGGAVAILSRTNPNEIVDFYYGVNAGFVYYSTIPLECYMPGGNCGGFFNESEKYSINEPAFQASLAGPTSVPEPSTLLLMGFGLVAGLVWKLKRG